MLKFCSLFSGSSGNCIFVGTERTRLLLDAGVSGTRIINSLYSIGEDPIDIQGIFITHEHQDHIMGAGVLSRRFDMPIYANEKTWSAMSRQLGKIREHNIRVIQPDNQRSFVLGDIVVSCYPIPHDAADPMAYTFAEGTHKIGVATDIGFVSDEIRENLRGCELILLESNHDVEMLRTGRYPWPLKQRILSNHGHLSNDCAADLVSEMVLQGTKYFMLGHLSQENNSPECAYETTRSMLWERGIVVGRDVALIVASRTHYSEVLRLG